MYVTSNAGFCATFLILVTSCAIPDNERCGDGYFYDVEKKACKEIKSTDTGTDTENKDGGVHDSGAEDAGYTPPTGMGEYCESQEDCADYEADYCVLDPFTQAGGCTIKNCTEEPDNCPPGWTCCNFPDSFMYPDICMPDEEYEVYGATACTG